MSLTLSTIQNLGSPLDGNGFVEIDTLMIGEYTFGWKKSNVGLFNLSDQKWNIYPNPINDRVNVEVSFPGNLNIYDLHGKLLWQEVLNKGVNQISILDSIEGTLLFVYQNKEEIDVKKVIVQ